MSANLSAVPKLQFFDNNGVPLVGGKLYTYAAGTTTPLATYTDASAGTPNTNPIILDSRGEANVWVPAASYKFVLKDSTDVTIWTVDNISNALNLSQILANSGSAASPPYTFASDATTGMYLAAVGQIGVAVSGVPVVRSTSTAMTLGQSGGANDVNVTHYGALTVHGAAVFNEAGADKDFRVEGDTDANLLFVDASTDRVGIGTNTPSAKLHYQGSVFRQNDSTNSFGYTIETSNSTTVLSTLFSGSSFAIYTGNSVTPRLFIDDAGGVGLGGAISGITSSQFRLSVLGTTQALETKNTGGASQANTLIWNNDSTGDNIFITFNTNTTLTQRGSIDYNRTGGLVRYNTTSDYRAKNIIGSVQNPGATIDALKVYEGIMKDATQSRPMLIAHEAQEHVPYAVSGVKDEVKEDGTPILQQIDVSSLVPLLIAEIQLLRERVASLEKL